jgi:hypothetical protein
MARDIIPLVEVEDLAAELGGPPDEQSIGARLERHLARQETRDRLIGAIEGILGARVRALLRRANLPSDGPRGDSLLTPWLRLRGVPDPVNPRARPQNLLKWLRENALQAANNTEEEYALAKSAAPELERLMRVVAFYYLHSFPGEKERVEAIGEALRNASRNGFPAQEPERLPSASGTALLSLSLSQLAAVLAGLDHCREEPAGLARGVLLKVVPPEERLLLQQLIRARNRVQHGTSSPGETPARFCDALGDLACKWSERRVVPRGGVVRIATAGELGGTRTQCQDEWMSDVQYRALRGHLKRGDSVLFVSDSDASDIEVDYPCALPAVRQDEGDPWLWQR